MCWKKFRRYVKIWTLFRSLHLQTTFKIKGIAILLIKANSLVRKRQDRDAAVLIQIGKSS